MPNAPSDGEKREPAVPVSVIYIECWQAQSLRYAHVGVGEKRMRQPSVGGHSTLDVE